MYILEANTLMTESYRSLFLVLMIEDITRDMSIRNTDIGITEEKT